MAEKRTVEVVIDGKIYQLSGDATEGYMHEVASYLNQKILDFKRQVSNYNKLDDNIKALLLEINICDDLFREQDKTRKYERDKDEAERESYSAKHDLVNMQVKLETTLKELENTQRRLAETEAKLAAKEARERALSEDEKVTSIVSGARKKN
ncbi:cell division protein ZapA [Oribacterium sp. WCC10]|uniref:cell division protein ZapA n=1 Tax=Oribacterium sp. WCC10 TaxID=1855343 RepID=UPI0008E0BEA7|nr:cell division protein ZapA [Oribacterium sp. WCC10]SFG06396.1 cell division protein ZapA [Oribacterium sp. WCC10]